MKQSEFKARADNVFSTYENLFDPELKSWGAYEITYMPGWLAILEHLFSKIASVLSQEQAERFSIRQIKEKFGTLRFYYSGQELRIDVQGKDGISSIQSENPENEFSVIDDLIQDAVDKSARTCMFCGDEGSMRRDGWFVVLCDHHDRLQREGKRIDQDFELMTTPSRRH